MSNRQKIICVCDLLPVLMLVSVGWSLAGCKPVGGGRSPDSSDSVSVRLVYNHQHDQPGDDVGGAQQKVDVPLLWAGARVLAGNAQASSGDMFNVNDSWHGYSTEPWMKDVIVSNLNAGDWTFSVTVNNQLLTCSDPIELTDEFTKKVTFWINERSGAFDGCTG